MASFARGLASLTRIALSTSKTPLQIIHRRGLADHHGPPRDAIWEDAHAEASFVDLCACLLRGGLVFYAGFKMGACGQDKKEEVMAKESTKA